MMDQEKLLRRKIAEVEAARTNIKKDDPFKNLKLLHLSSRLRIYQNELQSLHPGLYAFMNRREM